MDDFTFSPLEWENDTKKQTNSKELLLRTKDYESTQDSLIHFVEQGYMNVLASNMGIKPIRQKGI